MPRTRFTKTADKVYSSNNGQTLIGLKYAKLNKHNKPKVKHGKPKVTKEMAEESIDFLFAN
jgi:hypothetical protein